MRNDVKCQPPPLESINRMMSRKNSAFIRPSGTSGQVTLLPNVVFFKLFLKFLEELISLFPVRAKPFVEVIAQSIKGFLPYLFLAVHNHIFKERPEFGNLLPGDRG
ncbi:MAG: hypothetical protein PVG99_11855 [Desulfobacteraceae bacterium]